MCILCATGSIALLVLVVSIIFWVAKCRQNDVTKVNDSNSRQLSSKSDEIQLDVELTKKYRSLQKVEIDTPSESKYVLNCHNKKFTNHSSDVSSHSNDIQTTIDFQVLPVETNSSAIISINSLIGDDDSVDLEQFSLHSQHLSSQEIMPKKTKFDAKPCDLLTCGSQMAEMRHIFSMTSGMEIDSTHQLDASITASDLSWDIHSSGSSEATTENAELSLLIDENNLINLSSPPKNEFIFNLSYWYHMKPIQLSCKTKGFTRF